MRFKRKNKKNKNKSTENNIKQNNATDKISVDKINNNNIVAKVFVPSCHVGFTQIHENIYVGKATDVESVLNKVDILIPLDNVDGDIWDTGWNGEIYYVPIKDFSILPKHIEEQKVQYVLDRIKEGKRVAVFCLGGHGRTGYFASLLMGKLGIKDPIKVLREQYCKSAVETNEQVKAIADFIDNQELTSKYKSYFGEYYDYGSYYDMKDWEYGSQNAKEEEVVYCGQCLHYSNEYDISNWGHCVKHNKTIYKYSSPCGSLQ